MSMLLEVCVDTAAGLLAAIAGGAQRIELCSALGEGGLTPSAGLMKLAGQQGTATRAMIRPRCGDFHYDPIELALMCDDIDRARDAGLEGVVIGAARADGQLDEDALARLVQAARGMKLTLHRVVDLLPSPRAGVALARDLGIDTILTSGGAIRAIDGLGELAAMVDLAGQDLTIMPGSGIRAENVAALYHATGARAFHASCTHLVASGNDRAITMGFAPARQTRTDCKAVESLRMVLDNLAPSTAVEADGVHKLLGRASPLRA